MLPDLAKYDCFEWIFNFFMEIIKVWLFYVTETAIPVVLLSLYCF